MLVTQRQGAALVGRAANDLGPVGAGDAFRHLAVDRTRDQEAGLETAPDPVTDAPRAKHVVLVPVGWRANRLAVEEFGDGGLGERGFAGGFFARVRCDVDAPADLPLDLHGQFNSFVNEHPGNDAALSSAGGRSWPGP